MTHSVLADVRNLLPAFYLAKQFASAAPQECACSWVHSPRFGLPGKPWVIKYPSALCIAGHYPSERKFVLEGTKKFSATNVIDTIDFDGG